MTEDPESQPSRSQLRQEAADWFAILRGPEADDRREEFEQWLARGALHRRSYNSVSGNFALGKFLKEEASEPEIPTDLSGDRSQPRYSRAAQVLTAAAACGLGVSALGVTWHVLERRAAPTLPPVGEAAGSDIEARYATAVGEIRKFALPDGSSVILDTDSLIFVSLTPRESNLRLMKGRARFFTGSDKHEMVVRADTAAVRAYGAVFDVALSGERHVNVQSIAGRIDVQHNAGSGPVVSPSSVGLTSAVAHIYAGSQLALEDGKLLSTGAVAVVQSRQWPDGVEQFNDVPLSLLTAEANRYATKPIRFGQPELAGLKISGTFRLSDTKHIALQVARLLDLQVSSEENGYILYRNVQRN